MLPTDAMSNINDCASEQAYPCRNSDEATIQSSGMDSFPPDQADELGGNELSRLTDSEARSARPVQEDPFRKSGLPRLR